MMNERSGQSPTPIVRICLDCLETCELRPGGNQTHLSDEPTVDERAEPPAVASLDEAAIGLRLRRDVGAVGRGLNRPFVASQPQLDALVPVLIRVQRAVDGAPVRVCGFVNRHGGHDRLRLGVEAMSREPAKIGDRAVLAVESERNVLGPRERGGEAIQPRLGRIIGRYPCQQEKVPPPMGRVVRAANNEVVTAVLDLRPTELQQGEVGSITQRSQLHNTEL